MAYSQAQLVSFSLNLAGAHVSVSGVIASYYLIKEFRSFLSYALILMHICFALKLICGAIAALALTNTITSLTFLSWCFNTASLALYMLQMMQRLWLLPPSGDWLGDRHYKAGLIQWLLFSLAMVFFGLNSLCWLPIKTEEFITCQPYSTIFLVVGIFMMLVLCISSSFYMIVAVTHSKVSLDRKADYLQFSRRRLPVLSLNIAISLGLAVLLCFNYQHGIDIANYLFSLVILTSTYYFVDFKEFMLLENKSSRETNIADGRGDATVTAVRESSEMV